MKHPASSRKVSLLTTMQKTLILAAELIRLDEDVAITAKEVKAAMAVKLVRNLCPYFYGAKSHLSRS